MIQRRPTPAALALALVLASALEAQERAIRGAVFSESGDRVPFALVALTPGGTQFSADDGRFAFTALSPGSYRVVVRQVGYRPFDTTVTVEALPVNLRVTLLRVAVQLAAISVTAEAACVAPGPPDSTSEPALFALFQQLRENAARAVTLEEQYPFRHFSTRRISMELENGRSFSRVTDTLEFRSEDRWQYRPGRVVEWGRGRQSRTKLVHLPELPDLASDEFHRHHCFRLAGVDTIDGRPLVRLDFRASARLREADIDGSAWLDPQGYQLRRLRIELTNVARELRGVAALNATVIMREELPYILLTDAILGITLFSEPLNGIVAQTEEQRFLRVEFERRPGEVR